MRFERVEGPLCEFCRHRVATERSTEGTFRNSYKQATRDNSRIYDKVRTKKKMGEQRHVP